MTDEQISCRDILLQTPDILAASAFYQETLGLRLFMNQPKMIGLEAGAFRLFLEKAEPLGPVLEFFVDDLAHAKAALIERGCKVEVEDASVPKCYLRDPYGLTFNIAEHRG